MYLYFLRHGDAVEAWKDDAGRPLTTLGEQQAHTAGKLLKHRKIQIEMILASPLERTKQMATIVAGELQISNYTISEFLVPESNPRNIIQQLNTIRKESVLLVGHEPNLRSLISLLVTSNTQSEIILKKGTLACIEAALPLTQSKGTLQWLMEQDRMKTEIAQYGDMP